MADQRLRRLIAAGLMILLICTWRVLTNKTQDYSAQISAASTMRSISSFRGDFEGLDSDNRLVRLSGFLGRHRVIVVFFDGGLGADKDPQLLRLRERYSDLAARSIKIIAVSTALPQENRAAMTSDRGGVFPFPLVSDIDPMSQDGMLQIHRRWGRIDLATGKPVPAVFAIDRKGEIAVVNGLPKPAADVDDAIECSIR